MICEIWPGHRQPCSDEPFATRVEVVRRPFDWRAQITPSAFVEAFGLPQAALVSLSSFVECPRKRQGLASKLSVGFAQQCLFRNMQSQSRTWPGTVNKGSNSSTTIDFYMAVYNLVGSLQRKLCCEGQIGGLADKLKVC